MPTGIYTRTEDYKKRMSKIRKGICFNTGKTHFKKGHIPIHRFKKGHIPWFKLHPELAPKGKDNWKWKGGKTIDKNGYILILKPEHPYCSKNRYISEHRLIVEKYLGRYLKSKERVHHINKIENDNRIENLMVFKNHGYHMSFHRFGKCNPIGIIFDGHLFTP